MGAELLDGKAAAKSYRKQVAERVAAFTEEHGRPPGLDVVLVGEDPASVVYTRNKEKAAGKVGIRGKLHKLDASTTEAALLDLVTSLNASDETDGLLVQLPLPDHVDPDRVVDAISPAKDVDGFHPVNTGLLSIGRTALEPCTARGIMHLLASADVALEGAHAVVVGRSNIVGKPVAQMLLREHATVTIAHSRTQHLDELCRQADVLVVAVGRPKMVGGDWIKPGAVVVDVGINRTEDGKLVGDVDFEPAAERASWITPVPGGVGPMTIAFLLDNTVIAARRRLQAG
ncbi:MAG: bifunctional methylenetetrahydrofolate dehydrogenase/methenyltetrahydrofolate cyclohydrolase FolD [Deltaproteobacteria bacterium]|jgi:methylenetetrahydrofolate dehydrogenase (NADP+)/methenyltetrahydrofolate cyclohydrolase|nr:bifunctional methylenetetrahydrofolate dehydrogenase/methenyltetrahydrofolate cyclohydrolase FolD [Deltaproteobacteria bacterium]MBW2537399.1 bifunctional methylenetetrahydrofolate dehydrogenase/methenyltetrahydrofolate cyclohydrolase FolD [Deltaproteobacteria bacterium]